MRFSKVLRGISRVLQLRIDQCAFRNGPRTFTFFASVVRNGDDIQSCTWHFHVRYLSRASSTKPEAVTLVDYCDIVAW